MGRKGARAKGKTLYRAAVNVQRGSKRGKEREVAGSVLHFAINGASGIDVGGGRFRRKGEGRRGGAGSAGRAAHWGSRAAVREAKSKRRGRRADGGRGRARHVGPGRQRERKGRRGWKEKWAGCWAKPSDGPNRETGRKQRKEKIEKEERKV